MEKSFIFNSINGDRKMKAEDFREYFIPFLRNGIYPNPSTKLQVVSNQGMNVIVREGKAFINGSLYINDSDLIITLDPADGVLNRIDRVVLRMDTLERNIKCIIKKGQFASNPVATELQRDADAYELCIAEILVSKGSIDILQSMITDTRLNTEICGIVTGLIDQVDTTELYRQLKAHIQEKSLDMSTWINEAKEYFSNWLRDTQNEYNNEFNNWFDTIKGVLDGDIAGNLANRILELENKVGSGLTANNILMNDGSNVQDAIDANETSIQNAQNDIQNLQTELGANKTVLEANINAIREVL